MSEETVIIYGARADRNGHIWSQYQPGGSWYGTVEDAAAIAYPTLEGLEEHQGPTRPVRVCTVDPARDAVIEAAKAWQRSQGAETAAALNNAVLTLLFGEAVEFDKAQLRAAGFDPDGPPAAPESPPTAEPADTIHPDTRAANAAFMAARDAAEQATPAPQDTTGAVDNFSRVVDNGWGEGIWEDIGRTGLSAEQEIRARAAELLLADRIAPLPLGWKLGDWCVWIRDGRTPDEAPKGPGFADVFVPEHLRPEEKP